jgi:hypothetical protein
LLVGGARSGKAFVRLRVRIRFGPVPEQLGKSQPLHLVRALQAEQLRAEKGSS